MISPPFLVFWLRGIGGQAWVEGKDLVLVFPREVTQPRDTRGSRPESVVARELAKIDKDLNGIAAPWPKTLGQGYELVRSFRLRAPFVPAQFPAESRGAGEVPPSRTV